MQDLKLLPKKKLIINKDFILIKQKIDELGLHTVCQSARCPNIYECFSQRRLTFLILGNICTRGCKFCSVSKGKPLPPDQQEAFKISEIVREFNINYVVITSVTRDDLRDFGANHFVKVITELKRNNSEIKIEVLIPDFKARRDLIWEIVKTQPDCIGHNIETVRRLSNQVRKGASYESSLSVLRIVKELNSEIITKSAILLGLGEEKDEILSTIRDLKTVNCDILVLGQYLKPDSSSIEVKRMIEEREFNYYKNFAQRLGFKSVFAGTLVRSSNAVIN